MAIPIGEYKQAVEALAYRMKAFYDRAIDDIEKEWKKNYISGSKFANEIKALAEETNQEIDNSFVERYCHKAVMSLMLKFLFLRFAEDKRILKPYFRSEAIEKWKRENKNPQEVIKEAFENAREKFKGLYKITPYDEFLPSNETLEIYLIDALSNEPQSGLYKGKGALDFATLDPRVVSAFYEKLFDRKKRKELGLFFTPPVIAEYLVEKAFEEQKITKDFLVLDPACGSGQILLAAYRKLKDIFVNQLEMSPGEAHKRILSHNLWGIDVEPFAVLLSKINLALQDLENIPEYINIIHGDSLLETGFDIPQVAMFKDVGEGQKQKLIQETIRLQGGKEITVWRNGFGRILLEKPIEQKQLFELVERMKTGIFSESGIRTMKDLPKKFDVILGNPPWISMDDLPKNKKQLYEEKFQNLKGRYDVSTLFVYHWLKSLKKDGLLGFILPETHWIGEYFQYFRKYLQENIIIKEILSLKEGVFEDTANPSSIFICVNTPPRLPQQEFLIGRITLSGEVKKEKVKMAIDKRVIFDSFIIHLIDKVSLFQFKILDEIAFVTDGIQTADLLSKIFTQKPLNLNNYYKALRSGKAIPGRYGLVKWDGWWVLKPEFTKKFKRPGFSYDTPKRMKCFSAKEKIILRQTEPTIVATIDNEGFYFPNSIFQIALDSEDHVKLMGILAILNSKFIRFFYGKLAQVEGTTKPQLYLNILKSLPIPQNIPKLLAKMADKMLELNKKLQETEKSFYEFVEEKIKNKIPLREIEGLNFVNIKDSRAKLGEKGKINATQEENTLLVLINKKPVIKIICQDKISSEFLSKYLDGLRTNILAGKDGDSWIERILNTRIHWNEKSNLEKSLEEYKNLQSSAEEIKKQIAETDKKIDEMVYNLYGITEEERKIIEESL
jgi:hypothetical protein